MKSNLFYALMITLLFTVTVGASEVDSIPVSKVESIPQKKAPSSSVRWANGVILGWPDLGFISKLWIKERIGFQWTGYGTYSPKGAGSEISLLLRLKQSGSFAPYLYAGGGYRLGKLDTLYLNQPVSQWVDKGSFSTGIGAEIWLGESEKHQLFVQAGYRMSRGYYEARTSSLGSVGSEVDSIELSASPLSLSLGYTFNIQKREDRDSDRDGIFDAVDKCIDVPEDIDGFFDTDGCPDDDNDGDGVVDSLDKCPTELEDLDGVDDGDGCPDNDNDGDGVVDSLDRCPTELEDLDGFQDDDGCPDEDNDGDKLLDVYDACPNQAEDLDHFNDVDGCPELDNDKDGFADVHDSCPNEAEIVNLYLDDDGCPDTVFVFDTGPMVLEGVQFSGAQLQESSFALLDEIVRSLKIWPEIRLEISGHTDARGNAQSNKNLSKKRAEVIRDYFIAQGIAAERVVAKGYGKDKPIAHNSSAAGRAKNRRIEILVLTP